VVEDSWAAAAAGMAAHPASSTTASRAHRPTRAEQRAADLRELGEEAAEAHRVSPGEVRLSLRAPEGMEWLWLDVRVFDGAGWRELGPAGRVAGPPLFSEAADATVTLLASGDVLIAGSGNQDAERHASAEDLYSAQSMLFHPATETVTRVTPLPARRAFAGDALLPDGCVLILGGATTPNRPISAHGVLPMRFALTIEDSTLYHDPSADSWSHGPRMAEARYDPGVTVLPGGDVLVVGGFDADNGALRSVERYHVDTGTWCIAASTLVPRVWHVQALLPSGRVLVAGGIDAVGNAIDSVEVYDPEADTWHFVAPLPLPTALAAGLTLDTGDVMVTGGFQEGATKVAIPQAVAYREADDAWIRLPRLTTGRFYHSAVQLEDGRVLIAAGLRNDLEVMHGAVDTEISSVALR